MRKPLLILMVVSALLSSIVPSPVAEAASQEELSESVTCQASYVPRRWLFSTEDVSPFNLVDSYAIQLQCLQSQGYVFSYWEQIRAIGRSQAWRRAPFNGQPTWSIWLYNGCQNIQVVPVSPGEVGPWVQVWVRSGTPEPEPVPQYGVDPAKAFEREEGKPKPYPVPVPVPSGTPQPQHITVQRGDTLYGIARRYGTTVEVVKALNKLRSNNIWVGQDLIVPPFGVTVTVYGSRAELELRTKELGIGLAVVTLIGWAYTVITNYGWMIAFAW